MVTILGYLASGEFGHVVMVIEVTKDMLLSTIRSTVATEWFRGNVENVSELKIRNATIASGSPLGGDWLRSLEEFSVFGERISATLELKDIDPLAYFKQWVMPMSSKGADSNELAAHVVSNVAGTTDLAASSGSAAAGAGSPPVSGPTEEELLTAYCESEGFEPWEFVPSSIVTASDAEHGTSSLKV